MTYSPATLTFDPATYSPDLLVCYFDHFDHFDHFDQERLAQELKFGEGVVL